MKVGCKWIDRYESLINKPSDLINKAFCTGADVSIHRNRPWVTDIFLALEAQLFLRSVTVDYQPVGGPWGTNIPWHIRPNIGTSW